MKILVISDLHLDKGDHFGSFGWNQEDFIRKVEYTCALYDIDQVILNGDIFELIKYRYDDIVAANRVLIDFFQMIGAIVLRGNHDIALRDLPESHCIINSKGERIHIEHGHRADFLNGTMLGRRISAASLILLKAASRNAFARSRYFDFIKRDDGIVGVPRYTLCKYLAYAYKLLMENDVVLLGHTHRLETSTSLYTTTKKLYLNSGSCSLGKFQAIVMDTETLRYELLNDAPERELEGPATTHSAAQLVRA
jgi:predicted phosphodiesterase